MDALLEIKRKPRSWFGKGHKIPLKKSFIREHSLRRRLRLWLPHGATLGEIVGQ